MNIKKILISLFVLCFAIVCFIGCTHTTTQSAHGKVAVITKGSDSDFWSDLKSGAVTAATEYNLELTVEGPDNESDCEAQNKLIRNAISRKVDVIVLSAIDYNNTAPAVQEAVDSGIKVIMIDSNVNVKNTQSFIGTNNIQAGKKAGEAVEKLCKDKGKIYIGIVSSGENTENNNERQQGFADYIGTLENAEIVKTVYVSSDQDNATAEAKRLLTEHPESMLLSALTSGRLSAWEWQYPSLTLPIMSAASALTAILNASVCSKQAKLTLLLFKIRLR